MLKFLIVIYSLGLIWSMVFMLNRKSTVLLVHDVDASKEPLKKFEIYNMAGRKICQEKPSMQIKFLSWLL
jgi:hypothetical protein